MVNRDRHDIIIDILKRAANGKNKTELMRDVGLSYLQTKQYFTVLLEKGLLGMDGKHCYKTTKKGLEFMEQCEDCLLQSWPTQKRK